MYTQFFLEKYDPPVTSVPFADEKTMMRNMTRYGMKSLRIVGGVVVGVVSTSKVEKVKKKLEHHRSHFIVTPFSKCINSKYLVN